jgi:hypothetical protein
MLSHSDLRRLVGVFPAVLPRTQALEKSIGIGAGFQGKWYASQAEHWRGWIGYKEALLYRQGRDPQAVPASLRWRHLSCAPMMFWLAEAAAVPADLLDRAEQAAITVAKQVGHDHPSHGKAMRDALSWVVIEEALARRLPLTTSQVLTADAAVEEAHRKLVAKRGKKYE